MKQMLAAACALIVFAVPLSAPVAQSRNMGTTPEYSAPAARAAGQRCVVIHDVYEYKKGDRELPVAAMALQEINESERIGNRLLERGHYKGGYAIDELLSMTVTVTTDTCKKGEEKKAVDQKAKSRGEPSHSVMTLPTWPYDCNFLGCTHPNPPDNWYHLMPGSVITTQACKNLINTVVYEVTIYQKQNDGSWKMISYHAEYRETECGAIGD